MRLMRRLMFKGTATELLRLTYKQRGAAAAAAAAAAAQHGKFDVLFRYPYITSL